MDVIFGLLLMAGMAYGAYRAVRFAVAKVQHERGLTDEQRVYRKQLKDAEKGAKAAKKAYDKRVATMRKSLNQAQNPGPIASYGGVRLYEDRVDLGAQGTHPLSPQVSADVDTAGNLMQKHRSTVTRMGVGTLAAGPIGLLVGAAAKKSKDVDTRELWLTVTGPNFGTVVKANPDAGMQVRNLAQQISLAAQNVTQNKARRAQMIDAARNSLKRAEGDRTALDGAERRLLEIRAQDPERATLGAAPSPQTA